MAADPVSTRPLIDKLGVKEGMRVSVVNVTGTAFWTALKARTKNHSKDRPQPESDVIVLGTESRSELGRVREMRRFLKSNGGLWVVYPKGQQHITEANVMEAGLAAELVDNKVVSFSETHTGLRFVIPIAKR